jgi:predicted metal-binding membrane protein
VIEVSAAVLGRDRALTLGALVGVAALAWAYIVHLAGPMARMKSAMVMPQTYPWGTGEVFWLFVMWAVMMTAMMLPSAAPAILLFANIAKGRKTRGTTTARPAGFVLGYLLAWTGYSALAAVTQSGLHAAALLSPATASASPWLGGTLLAAAGIYQWFPIKQRCLVHCRSPLGFFMTEWREGIGGAVRMGLLHGSYCVGCCWLLMALLFVAGVMNLAWVATLSFIVLLEKLAPAGRAVGRVIGLVMIGTGAWLFLASP